MTTKSPASYAGLTYKVYRLNSVNQQNDYPFIPLYSFKIRLKNRNHQK